MLKMVFLVHRRPDMDASEFSSYWRETHSQIAGKIPGLRKYVQNHSTVAPDGSSPPYDGFAEMWFDDSDALEKALATPEGEATLADTANFIDLERMLSFSVDEVTVV